MNLEEMKNLLLGLPVYNRSVYKQTHVSVSQKEAEHIAEHTKKSYANNKRQTHYTDEDSVYLGEE